MKKAKLAASLIAVSMAATTLLTGCNNNDTPSGGNSTPTNNSQGGGDSTPSVEAPKLEYADGTELRLAVGYSNSKNGIAFASEIAGEGVTLANGKTYQAGDLKPTWETLQQKLKIKFTDKFQGNSDSDEFNYWKEQLDQVDFVCGTAAQLIENGNAGKLVNIADYIESMPNFKAYLEENPIVRLSITGSTIGDKSGAIYFSPYFDGVDDIERMPLMRTDWVEKLLNGEGEFTAEKSGNTKAPSYQPYMPTSGTVKVDVVKKDLSGVQSIEKNYDKGGNIIAKMNEKGAMSGVEAVNMLRKYIDEAYDGYYGNDRADLFIGQNAAWDADELVALLRCVVANANTLNGTDKVQGLFSREDDNNQRRVDMFRFAGTLFGARGLESRNDYLYVGADGNLHDARMEEDTYIAIEKMHDMALEGLLSENFMNTAAGKTEQYLENDAGFMHYDYNQTQTLYNDSKLQAGEKYMAVMVPVAGWKTDGTDKVTYMRFTESWRSVKTAGWGISVAGVNGDTNKLNALLTLIDYAYSKEGQILMSYGPDEFIKMKDGKYVMFNFNGQDWPEIADKTREELWAKASGNYTNYARMYLGSTLSFLKSQAFEYQCTTEAGREGAGHISNAIGFGTIKHPELAIATNKWYTSMPTTLPMEKTDSDAINSRSELGSKGKFSSSKGGQNLLIDIIVGGYSGSGTSSRAETIATVKDTWECEAVLDIRQQAWEDLLEFYNS